MAQSEDALTGQKRGPGRPSKSDSRFEKKRKISTTLSTPISSSLQSPTQHSPAPESNATPKLPPKISSTLPLPTLPSPQPASLSASDYQSIAASGVLSASLDRSRLKWINEGVLERYWVKPESGKGAKPAPANNPDLKSQRHKGPCRIRVEPHIFEVEVYVEERVEKPKVVKQYLPPQYGQSAYGQPYRQNQVYGGQQQQQQYWQNRTLPPIQQQHHQQQQHMHAHHTPQPHNIPPVGTTQSPAPASQSSPPPQTQQLSPSQDKKASPDPVISMLATRASSDPELKALMKEVATGNASQEQLKVFQGHIDELTKTIADKKKKDEEEEPSKSSADVSTAAKVDTQQQQQQQQGEMIQYDGTAESNPVPPSSAPPPQQAYQHSHPQAQAQPYTPAYHPQQQPWQPPPPVAAPAPAAPAAQPVILAFTTPGATEDRFLFPQNSILEALSPQHLLASFIVTRKVATAGSGDTTTNGEEEQGGMDKDSSNGISAETPGGEVEYYQPITLMVEVAYNREFILECVKRWVKPAEEVRKNMEEVMGRCQRAPETFLPLRLPFKGSKDAAVEGSGAEESGMSTPIKIIDERPKHKGVKYVKKALKNELAKEKKGDVLGDGGKKDGAVAAVVNATDAPAATDATEETTGEQQDKAEDKSEGVDGVQATATATATATAAGAATETGRPRRATRKSVRISEG